MPTGLAESHSCGLNARLLIPVGWGGGADEILLSVDNRPEFISFNERLIMQ